MEENYFIKIKKELLSAGFPQEVSIRKKYLDWDSIQFLMKVFWNTESLKKINDYVTQKQRELYEYSKEMKYISSDTTFEQFINGGAMKYGPKAVKYLNNTEAVSTMDNIARRYLYKNRQLGTFNPYKEGSEWKWDANGELFGKQIGEGSEQYVYENLKNPNLVLKIDGTGYSTPLAMRHGVQQYQKRNLIPYQEKAKFVGYMKGIDAAMKPAYYPVYSQKRLRLETNTTPMYWDHVLAPKINKMMQTKGYTGSATTSFTNGKYTVSDMSPYNIGYDNQGNIRFFDFYVE